MQHLRPVRSIALLALTAFMLPVQAGTSVGVSIGFAQPGMYGRIDIGTAAPPLMYPRPVLIAAPALVPAPVYMHVPPGHAKDWKKHCKHYGACGVPVYFVQDDWVQQHPSGKPGKGKGHGKG